MGRKKQKGNEKLKIVFDPDKRREFLTGFRKRRNERRTRAKKELEQSLKVERQRIRQQVREGHLNLKRSFAPLQELSADDIAINETCQRSEYDDEEVQVEIINLSTKEMTERRHLLGENCPANTAKDVAAGAVEEEVESCTPAIKGKGRKHKLPDQNRVPGMDFEEYHPLQTEDISKDNENESDCRQKGPDADLSNLEKYRSKKDMDRLKKNNTLKQLKKSKIFKIKERLDKQANRKRIRRDHNKTMRSLPKHVRVLKKSSGNKRCQYRKGRLMSKKELKRKMKQ